MIVAEVLAQVSSGDKKILTGAVIALICLALLWLAFGRGGPDE